MVFALANHTKSAFFGFPLRPVNQDKLQCVLKGPRIIKFRNHLDIIQFFDDWITGRTKILRENAYQLSKTQLEENMQDRAMHEELTKHQSELLNTENQFLNHQVEFWNSKMDQPLNSHHLNWINYYKNNRTNFT